MKYLKFLIILPLIFLVSCISSIGSNNNINKNFSQDIVTINFSWWGNDSRNEYTLEAIDKFMELNPNIQVNCIYTEWSGYQTRMNMKMVSETEEDVMQINYAWINQYSPNGDRYYDLNKLSNIIDLSNYTEEELSFGMKNGKLNAIPISLNTQVFFYNKELLESYGLEIPTTWNDLFKCASVVRNDGKYLFGVSYKSAMLLSISYVEQLTGKQFITEDGIISFDASDVKMMFYFYKKLVDEHVIPSIDKFDKFNFKEKNYIGIVGWITDTSNYCTDIDFECTIGEFIQLEQSSSLGWYSKPSTMYAISSNTKYPEECALLMDFLLNSQEMAELQKFEKGVPLSNSAQNYLKNINLLDTVEYKAFSKFVEHQQDIKTMPTYYENDDIINYFQDVCDNIHYFHYDISNEATKFLNMVQKKVSVSIGNSD